MAKNSIKLSVYIILILITCLFLVQQSWAYDWKIRSFDTIVDIQPDRTIKVTETITADFSIYKHGIIRIIPIANGFSFWGTTDLGFKLNSITDDKGQFLRYKSSYFNNYISLKIGDPDKTITGLNVYIIRYQMNKVIQTFQESDELYWNITGDNWDAPIDKATASFRLPKEIPLNSMQIKGFVGAYGSVNQNCISRILDSKNFYFEASNLAPREGLTGIARWPVGVIQKENIMLNRTEYLLNNWFIFLPFIVFVFLIYRWFTVGRDPRKRGTIVPMYEPPKINGKNPMSPTEVGILIDERLDPRDISACVINLAVKGFLKIKEIESKQLFFFSNKDYEFENLKDAETDASLTKFEKKLFNNIFGGKKKVLLSDLKYKFAEKLSELKKEAYDNMVKENLFSSNPEKVKANYITIGTLISIFGFISVLLLSSADVIKFTSLFLASVCVIISGVEFIIFAPFMPRKTKKGVELLENILGFEDYIKTAEKSRIEWEVKENIFEKYLPYAMVLRLEKQWADRFEGIYAQQPSWYEGRALGAFSAVNFTNSLSHTSSLMTQTFASTYRTSGSSGSGFSGGSSGGGSGGGGGSSW